MTPPINKYPMLSLFPVESRCSKCLIKSPKHNGWPILVNKSKEEEFPFKNSPLVFNNTCVSVFNITYWTSSSSTPTKIPRRRYRIPYTRRSTFSNDGWVLLIAFFLL